MHKISRSKIDLFIECPRCFWLDQVKGVKRPSGPAFSLNIAVDELFKKEFDVYRAKGLAHPLMKEYGIEAVPFQHEKIDVWRSNFTGVQYHHKLTDLLVFGAPDDIWVTPEGTLHVVDYKATSTKDETDFGSKDHHSHYMRQVEVYQWLLRQNGFKVSDTAYFVFANARKKEDGFHGRLEFEIKIFPHVGTDGWIEPILEGIARCFKKKKSPTSADSCEFCWYTASAGRNR